MVKEIWVVVEEYCSDGEIETDVLGAFVKKEDAITKMKQWKNINLDMPHWSKAVDDEEVEMEETETSVFAKMSCDDYYFNITITKTKLK